MCLKRRRRLHPAAAQQCGRSCRRAHRAVVCNTTSTRRSQLPSCQYQLDGVMCLPSTRTTGTTNMQLQAKLPCSLPVSPSRRAPKPTSLRRQAVSVQRIVTSSAAKDASSLPRASHVFAIQCTADSEEPSQSGAGVAPLASMGTRVTGLSDETSSLGRHCQRWICVPARRRRAPRLGWRRRAPAGPGTAGTPGCRPP